VSRGSQRAVVTGVTAGALAYHGSVTATPFVSRARDAEDVVLWRALNGVEAGFAVEIAPGRPFSPLAALGSLGWTVAPADSPDLAGALGAGPIHVLAGGDDAATVAVLGTLPSPPWVVLTASGSKPGRGANDPRKPIKSAGYAHCVFDGVNNFYLHESHRELADALSYPACSRDCFVSAHEQELTAALAQAQADLGTWRAAAVDSWARSATNLTSSAAAAELEAMRNTLSWRITKPLRSVRGLASGPGD
jgi:hypothetical protein